MSTEVSTVTQKQAVDAREHLKNEIFSRLVLTKAAEAGYVARNADDANKLVHMAGALLDQYNEGLAKEASAADPFLDFALVQLGGAPLDQVYPERLKAAASQALAQDPGLLDAATTFANYLLQN